MRISSNELANLCTRNALCCVWVRAYESKGAPLVARWIDPRKRDEDGNREARNDFCLELEAPEDLQIDPDLEFACEIGAF